MSRTLFVAALSLLLMTMRISAHHAFAAEYDENKRVTVSGIVTGFNWSNPHDWLYGLIHRGRKKAELKKADHVTLEGYGAKDGSNKANASTVTMPDGRKLFGGFQTTPGAPVK
jgi:hypothetical protein